MALTFKSSDITTIASTSTSTSTTSGEEQPASATTTTSQRRRRHFSRAEQEHLLSQLLERTAGMSPPSTSYHIRTGSSSSPAPVPRISQHQQPQSSSAFSTSTRSTSSSPPFIPSPSSRPSSSKSSIDPLSPPRTHAFAHQLSSTPPRSISRTAGSVRIAQAITQAAAYTSPPRSSSSSSDGSFSGRLSPSDRRERDAQRLSRLLDGRRPSLHQPPAASSANTSRSRTVRPERTLLADASWDMEPVPHIQSEPEPERELRSPVRARPLPSSLQSSLRPSPTPVSQPSRLRRPDPSQPSTSRIPPSIQQDSAMSDLEAEYEALRLRLDDAKRRFTKWHGVVAVKVQEEKQKRGPVVHWSADEIVQKEDEVEEEDGVESVEREQSQDHETQERPESEDEEQVEKEEDESEEKTQDTEQEEDEVDEYSRIPINTSTESVTSDDIKVTQNSQDPPPSTSPIPTSWRSNKLLPPKPVIGTTLTLSLLWTCGYLLTLLQWQMQHGGGGGARGADAYSDVERQWMGEYYDPMYPELYENSAAGLGGSEMPGPARALAGALRLLGGMTA
ncbi:hypothetical protein CF327_g1741 [Tilletia walkeri]|uniref:Uncharacterized protein n=1 Tax=Tilletia walkeri TaxID=117179 RepID=A0A8X7NB30_9BASI|nr:hypothetical protein CF327_g1741 [Tilletia walkeri]KAE8270616.1 hypothetical protein A4X09_0g1730 [Tilletia walkeri]